MLHVTGWRFILTGFVATLIAAAYFGGESSAAGPSAAAPASRQPAELSADELAALMGRPVSKPDAPAKEGTG